MCPRIVFLIWMLLLFALLASPMSSQAQEKKGIENQLEVLKAVRAEVKKKELKPAAADRTGPSGKIVNGVSNVCGKEYTVGQVADLGIDIGASAALGTQGSADTTLYQYVLYILVSDQTGKKIGEASSTRLFKNGDPNNELGYILNLQACLDPGKYKVEVFLFGIRPGMLYSLLDKGACEFVIK